MPSHIRPSFSLCLCVLFIGGVTARAANTSTLNVTLKSALKIPTAMLEPGNYTFQVEDQMPDRAIVRITNSADGAHYLVLSVPNQKLAGSSKDGLIYFPGSKHGVLQAWAASGNKTPLEFVYPKDEAVKITADTGNTALAVDPVSDKLPPNLSSDDMRVVTLWVLTPKQVTPDHRGQGVTASHLSDRTTGNALMAKANNVPKTLPRTATSTYSLFIAGIFALALGGIAHQLRLNAERSES